MYGLYDIALWLKQEKQLRDWLELSNSFRMIIDSKGFQECFSWKKINIKPQISKN